jgi:hypothetical protein
MSTAGMQTPTAIDPQAIRYVVPDGEAEPPLFRSRYGGLWVDRRDAHEILRTRHRLPELLHYGTVKGHHGDFQEYDRVLQTTLRTCE